MVNVCYRPRDSLTKHAVEVGILLWGFFCLLSNMVSFPYLSICLLEICQNFHFPKISACDLQV